MSRHDFTASTVYEHISLDDRIDVPQGVYNNESSQGLVYPRSQAQGSDDVSAGAQKGGYQGIDVQPTMDISDNSQLHSQLRFLRARRKAIR